MLHRKRFKSYLQRVTFQVPHWMPETKDSAKSYINYVCSYTHQPVIKSDLYFMHIKILTTVT